MKFDMNNLKNNLSSTSESIKQEANRKEKVKADYIAENINPGIQHIIDKQSEQLELNKKEIEQNRKDSKIATIISIGSIVIAFASLLVAIITLIIK